MASSEVTPFSCLPVAPLSTQPQPLLPQSGATVFVLAHFPLSMSCTGSGESLGIGGDEDWRLNFCFFTVNQKERENAILFTLILFLSEFLYTGHNFNFNHFLTKTKTDY